MRLGMIRSRMSMKLAQSRTTRNATEKRSGATTEERPWVVNEVLSRGTTIPPSHAYWRSGGMEQPPQTPEQRRRERKYAAQRIHEVERAVPLTSASAPHATTLARQPCRNLARMLVLRLKNLAYSLFFPAIITSVFPRNNDYFPSQSLAFSIVFHLRGASRPPTPAQEGQGLSPESARVFTAESRMALRQHRARRRNSIAYTAITAP